MNDGIEVPVTMECLDCGEVRSKIYHPRVARCHHCGSYNMAPKLIRASAPVDLSNTAVPNIRHRQTF